MHLLFVWQIWYSKIVLAERADHQNLVLEYILVVLSAPSAAAAHILGVWELECTLNEKGASFQEPTTVLRKEIPFSCRELPYFPPYFLPSSVIDSDSVIGISESPLSLFLPEPFCVRL